MYIYIYIYTSIDLSAIEISRKLLIVCGGLELNKTIRVLHACVRTLCLCKNKNHNKQDSDTMCKKVKGYPMHNSELTSHLNVHSVTLVVFYTWGTKYICCNHISYTWI